MHLNLSEKRTYLLNNELIYIIKSKKHNNGTDETITYQKLSNDIILTDSYTNSIPYNIQSPHLENAVRTVDSTEFFTMWIHFNNFKHDHEYLKDYARRVINTLMQRKIELHGSCKFELYDLRHLVEIDNFLNDTNNDFDDISYKYDGGYHNNIKSEVTCV